MSFTNPINLGANFAATRTIEVAGQYHDEYRLCASSPASFRRQIQRASPRLTKTGGGILWLTGANTFTGGGTAAAGGGLLVNNGTVAINSFAAGGPLGALTPDGGADVANRLVIGAAGNTASYQYVGPGETVSRQIQLAGTGGISRIENDGSGPLILTDVVNASTGTKTLDLRGNNTELNIVAVDLKNGAGTLAVSKNDGGLWELSGDNH